jgi:uncharacterized membrane protein YphA (DoxX/SURF4 family)
MKQKTLFVLCLLSALLFVNAGLNKFFHYIPIPPDLPEDLAKFNRAMTDVSWLMPLVGFVEIVGGVLYAIPRTRPLGAIMLFPILVGIVLTHLTVAPDGLPIALALLAINLFVIYDNRQKFLLLVS